MITPDVSFLSGTVFTILELTCSTPMEWAFYASIKIFVQKDMLLLHQEGRPSR